MLKYLIILLDDSSVSFCHYPNSNQRRIMPKETLKQGILFAMKHDLKIQYVLPPYALEQDYQELIDSMFHDTIGAIEQNEMAEIIVVNDFWNMDKGLLKASKRYIIRTSITDFLNDYKLFESVIRRGVNFNVVFTDVEQFTDDKIGLYRNALSDIGVWIKEAVLNGVAINTNIITDRIALDAMNNCGAGHTSVTLAPDGVFYPCPAFYYDKQPYGEIGNIETGLNIRSPKLYTLEGAPLCKRCDAFHCKRCVWLNKKLTCEINTPSRQQCVMAHVERNASRGVLIAFHKLNLLKDKKIKKVDYLDPFEAYQNI